MFFNKGILLGIILLTSCSTSSYFIDSSANDASYNDYEHYTKALQSNGRIATNFEVGNAKYLINDKELTKEAFFNSNLKAIEIIRDEKVIKEMGFDENINTLVIGIQ